MVKVPFHWKGQKGDWQIYQQMAAVSKDTQTGISVPDNMTAPYCIPYKIASFIRFIIFKFLHFLHKSCVLIHVWLTKLNHLISYLYLFCFLFVTPYVESTFITSTCPWSHQQPISSWILDRALAQVANQVLRGQSWVPERKGGAEGSGWRDTGLYS